jgi:hypothetical protein
MTMQGRAMHRKQVAVLHVHCTLQQTRGAKRCCSILRSAALLKKTHRQLLEQISAGKRSPRNQACMLSAG